MTRFRLAALLLVALGCAAPAGADIIHLYDRGPHVSPDGKIDVQFLIGPAVMSGQNISVNRLWLTAGAKVAEHRHETSDEILILISGKGTFTLNGVASTVQEGDTIFVPKNQPHAFEATEAGQAIQIYNPAGPEDRFKDWPVRPPSP